VHLKMLTETRKIADSNEWILQIIILLTITYSQSYLRYILQPVGLDPVRRFVCRPPLNAQCAKIEYSMPAVWVVPSRGMTGIHVLLCSQIVILFDMYIEYIMITSFVHPNLYICIILPILL